MEQSATNGKVQKGLVHLSLEFKETLSRKKCPNYALKSKLYSVLFFSNLNPPSFYGKQISFQHTLAFGDFSSYHDAEMSSECSPLS